MCTEEGKGGGGGSGLLLVLIVQGPKKPLHDLSSGYGQIEALRAP